MSTSIPGFNHREENASFNEYPFHIRTGNLTVTLLFHDHDFIISLRDILTKTIQETTPFEVMLEEHTKRL